MNCHRGLNALVMSGVLASAVLAQSGAQDPEVKASPTLEGLQRQIDELKAAQAKAPTTGDSDATMRVFGRIHLDFWTFPSTDPGINVFENNDPTADPSHNVEFRRARIGVEGDIREDMVYKIELEFGHPDDFAFKDLYFGFENVPVVQTLLIGNQKRPYGLDHLNSSRYNVFAERPFFIESNNQDARRFGIAGYGVSQDQAWNWRYGFYDQTDWSKSGEVVTGRFQPEITGRLARTLWWDEESGGRNYAHAAVSGMVGWPNGMPASGDTANTARYRTRPEARSQSRWIDTGAISGANNNYLVGVEAVVNLDSLQIVGEFANTWVSRGTGETVMFPGAYIYAAYFLTGEYMPWNRRSGTLARPKPSKDAGWLGAWQVAARYSWADYSDRDIMGGVGNALTLGLNWYWNKHASMQFNYIHGRIDERAVTLGPTTYDGGDYDILGARIRVDF